MKFKEILEKWKENRQEEEKLMKNVPEEHSQKTPDCLSFSYFEAFIKGEIELTLGEHTHIEQCPYCQKVLAMFQEEIGERRDVVRLAADDNEQTRERILSLQKRIGDELKRVRIQFTENIRGELAIEDEHSLWLILKDQAGVTHEFDNNQLEFFLPDRDKTDVKIIEDGVVLIDMRNLGISIEDYGKIRMRMTTRGGIIETHVDKAR